VEQGKIEKVTARGDSATVYLSEPDGDREKFVFLREGGEWKVWLGMPKAKKR
jgi:hypothetical protein